MVVVEGESAGGGEGGGGGFGEGCLETEDGAVREHRVGGGDGDGGSG